jgi:N-hydroxyarylamine O-acetyltransferase
MEINRYLERIRYSGRRTPDRQTLVALHQAHLLAIPYENLDIHLGRPLTLDMPAIYHKLVESGRGGWCYEMNGLFAWVLQELGFRVTLLASAVNRAAHGAAAERNHLILRVDLERPYLVDVGFGNGFRFPLPLQPGRYPVGFQDFELVKEADRWHLLDHGTGGPGYDFALEPRRMSDFAAQCQHLQTDPDSGFVRTTVCYRFTPTGFINLRGVVLRVFSATSTQEQSIEDEAHYASILRDQLGIRLAAGESARLWTQVWQRHQTWLAEQQVAG